MMNDSKRRYEERTARKAALSIAPEQLLNLAGFSLSPVKNQAQWQELESGATLVPWRGRGELLIDRFDVRASLDIIPTAPWDKNGVYEEVDLVHTGDPNKDQVNSIPLSSITSLDLSTDDQAIAFESYRDLIIASANGQDESTVLARVGLLKANLAHQAGDSELRADDNDLLGVSGVGANAQTVEKSAQDDYGITAYVSRLATERREQLQEALLEEDDDKDATELSSRLQELSQVEWTPFKPHSGVNKDPRSTMNADSDVEGESDDDGDDGGDGQRRGKLNVVIHSERGDSTLSTREEARRPLPGPSKPIAFLSSLSGSGSKSKKMSKAALLKAKMKSQLDSVIDAGVAESSKSEADRTLDQRLSTLKVLTNQARENRREAGLRSLSPPSRSDERAAKRAKTSYK